jgi:phage portal protein BeeE
MALAEVFAETEGRHKAARESARLTLTKAAGGGPGGAYSPGGTIESSLYDRNMASATKQYRAAKTGWPYAAIRPAAVKIAEQPIRAGRKKKAGGKGSGNSSGSGKFKVKSSAPAGFKQFAEGLEVMDDHTALSIFENPNPHSSGWSLLHSTGFSILATGQGFWWIVDRPQAADTDSLEVQPAIQLWYLPSNWVKPIHKEGRPFSAYRVTPPGTADVDGFIVQPQDMCHFLFPDPEDPTQPMSPLQALARAVNTDDEIQKAQYASMINAMKPGMVLTAGRLDPPPGMTGQGPRPVLTPEQRQQLISSIRMAYAGAMHFGDPIIVDGMIEGVEPYTLTPAELDFMGGSTLTKDRIFQGIGTNPIVAGQIQDANRAQAAIAHEGFYGLVVNPVAGLISQEVTRKVGPRVSAGGERIYIWIEEAKARDADLERGKMQDAITAGNGVLVDEFREWMGLTPFGDARGQKFIGEQPPPPPGGPGGVKPAKPKGKR